MTTAQNEKVLEVDLARHAAHQNQQLERLLRGKITEIVFTNARRAAGKRFEACVEHLRGCGYSVVVND